MLSTRPDKSDYFLYFILLLCGLRVLTWFVVAQLGFLGVCLEFYFCEKQPSHREKLHTSSQSHQLIQTRVNKVCRCENALKEADSLHFSESGERNMPDYFLLGDYFCVFPFVFFVINRPSLNLTLLSLYFAFCMFSRLFLSVNLYVFDT